jgi:uncharacterized membrane protein YqiK
VETVIIIVVAVLIIVGWLAMHRELRRRARKDDL